MVGQKQKFSTQSELAINSFLKAIKSESTLLRTDTNLVLVCGKKETPSLKTGREQFLEYAKNHCEGFHFFIAETIFKLKDKDDEIDLLSLEEHLIAFCDCVLIILESESTFAELGAFASAEKLVERILVVNDIKFEDGDSFITLGPLAKINKKSKFKPVIHVDFDSILRAATELKKRLSVVKRKNRTRIDMRDLKKFNNLAHKHRMLFLLDLITLFHPISKMEIVEILKRCYGNFSINIDTDLHLLVALDMVATSNGFYYRLLPQKNLFYDYEKLNTTKVRAAIINHYHKNYPEKIKVLMCKVGEV